MNKINHYSKIIINRIKSFKLTTPTAVLLGSVIIALGILGYGVIITNNSGSSTTANPLTKILKDLNIKEKNFVSCVNSEEAKNYVASSTEDGITAGVNGTPTTFILKEQNGAQYVVAAIVGAREPQFFQQAIEEALSLKSTAKLKRFNGRPVSSDDLQEVGSPTDVYIVEYSDAECPYCISLHNTMKQIRNYYAGKVSFVYRSFPLSFHPHAQREAEMIVCAGKLGGAKTYYGFIDNTFDYKIKNNIGYMQLNN